ncbi:hypothetical protein U9M48_037147 [Paspalum notatum var. saurae]|uniref:TTF-type domain-containing protein n=1 Tax=Paspalum notatum var. saurae TaxID=547442 RepID=A0AAQ3UGG1_PASNO
MARLPSPLAHPTAHLQPISFPAPLPGPFGFASSLPTADSPSRSPLGLTGSRSRSSLAPSLNPSASAAGTASAHPGRRFPCSLRSPGLRDRRDSGAQLRSAGASGFPRSAAPVPLLLGCSAAPDRTTSTAPLRRPCSLLRTTSSGALLCSRLQPPADQTTSRAPVLHSGLRPSGVPPSRQAAISIWSFGVIKMKRKGPVVDLKSFLEKAAAKKRAQEQTQTNLNPSICQESQMQLVIYQGQSEGVSSSGPSTIPPEPEPEISDIAASDNESKSSDEDIDESIYNIEHDPGLRSPILSYGVNDQDTVRRAYIALGPCRPKMKACDFPQHNSGGMRHFQPKWFDEFKWLEYSVHKDAAYCFVCYLFKDGDHGKDAFVSEGFRNWNMKDRIRRHAGAIDSAHCEAEEKYNLFIKPKLSIHKSFASNTAQYKADYLARLTWSLKRARYLARQGLPFHGHDEKTDSKNKGNFRELLSWLAGNFECVNRVVGDNR